LGKGLDEVHPFCDTTGVHDILREAHLILSPNAATVSRRSASRIWGFMSKFAMLDRFGKTLGVAKMHPGKPVARTPQWLEYFGTGARVSDLLINSPYFAQMAFSC